MAKISSLEASSRTYPKMSSSISTRQHSFLSPFMMSMTIVILLVSVCPHVTTSPTSIDQNNENKYESNGLILDSSNYQEASTGESSLLSSPTVQHLLSRRASWRFTQPRTHANQFLMSRTNDNEVILPKWYTRLNNNDKTYNINNNDDKDDDLDEYLSPNALFTKRSKYLNTGKFSKLNKRKQVTKAPMEVMNEIVNSIYL
ncbi:unnamed protein product [Rotaria magnacalcarata]|uniref:Uncharacterized protein n=1 Tax=Rotaria magnacalcarata TaxID=392030 RepID=A0A814ZJD2_9BILA|nr:unnamed protein product [Rotaria magnacalcarata]CAF1243714.1 unnamed protein product [Rotaria magnacalcarata]CAF1929736.1 unnamed protein product [Rotaria magnacalcarata]CAF1947756.1 unnamed protein product [Rotaria magnacalcarata]CAF2037526.1 unnamed protein product [Rotaria magnacalcarata]